VNNLIKVIFECSENMNKYKEEFEFEDDVTEDDIQDEFEDWVWDAVGDHYSWYRKE
jgi:hypothetical protein